MRIDERPALFVLHRRLELEESKMNGSLVRRVTERLSRHAREIIRSGTHLVQPDPRRSEAQVSRKLSEARRARTHDESMAKRLPSSVSILVGGRSSRLGQLRHRAGWRRLQDHLRT